MTNETLAPGQIPQSRALSEANPGSLNELFNRDPETYAPQDIDAIISVLRAQRARHEAAERAGPAPRKPKAAPASSAAAAELGL
jgi:hypothetical protein